MDLADALGVARASVCKAMDRLTEGGYAVRGGGGGLRLTEKGCEVVKNYAPARRLVRSMSRTTRTSAQRAERESLAGARSAERGYGQKDSAPLRRRRGEKVYADVFAPCNVLLKVVKMHVDEKIKRHLENLGISVNSELEVLSQSGGSVIAASKTAGLHSTGIWRRGYSSP